MPLSERAKEKLRGQGRAMLRQMRADKAAETYLMGEIEKRIAEMEADGATDDDLDKTRLKAVPVESIEEFESADPNAIRIAGDPFMSEDYLGEEETVWDRLGAVMVGTDGSDEITDRALHLSESTNTRMRQRNELPPEILSPLGLFTGIHEATACFSVVRGIVVAMARHSQQHYDAYHDVGKSGCPNPDCFANDANGVSALWSMVGTLTIMIEAGEKIDEYDPDEAKDEIATIEKMWNASSE